MPQAERFLSFSKDEQRRWVAMDLGLFPWDEKHWPERVIGELVAKRLNEGFEAYCQEIDYIRSPK